MKFSSKRFSPQRFSAKRASRRRFLRRTALSALALSVPTAAWLWLRDSFAQGDTYTTGTPRSNVLPETSDAVPACAYETILAERQSYDDWAYTLVDTRHHLPAGYRPPDLVNIAQAGFQDDRLVRALLLDDLRALREAAEAAGNPLSILSVYRSYEVQTRTFAYWQGLHGTEQARLVSARAGHSEHQLGTAIDFGSLGGPASWDIPDWAQTPAGAWLQEHAWRFGFVLSYPRDKTHLTCYAYEPWHFRYVGVARAQDIMASGLTLREWLWKQQPQTQLS